MVSLRARPRTRLFTIPLLAASLAAWLSASDAVAQGKVQELSRVLTEDSSYKVRVQAALVLGKLGDKAAVPALIRALNDENKTVRAMAAQALGQMGDINAIGPLDGLMRRDTDAFVRSQATKAMATLKASSATSGTPKKARIYVHVGSFSGGVKSAGSEWSKVVREFLESQFGKLVTITMALPAGVDDKSFSRSGMLGFFVDGNITRLDDTQVGGALETSCDVKVMVARWPSQSILLWTNAGATVQAGSRPQDKLSARKECFEAVANQLSEDLVKFLKSQGGQ